MGDISLRGRGKAYLASTKTSTREKFAEGGKPEVLKEEKKGIFSFSRKNKTIKKQRLKELDAELGIKRKEKAKGGSISKFEEGGDSYKADKEKIKGKISKVAGYVTGAAKDVADVISYTNPLTLPKKIATKFIEKKKKERLKRENPSLYLDQLINGPERGPRTRRLKKDFERKAIPYKLKKNNG